MDAQLLCVPSASAEVTQVAPPAIEVILEVDQRAEDINFANQLAAVLQRHINALANALPGRCTDYKASDVESSCWCLY